MNLFALSDEALIKLAKDHSTPFFVYDAATARRNFQRLRAALPQRVRLAYAVKANPHHELLTLFASLGASFDCASIGELERVAALDTGPGRIYFTGPGKRQIELERACTLNARIQAEGWEDLERLDRIARGPLNVNLRVHPAGGVEESNQIIGGSGPSAFGIDEEDLEEILLRAEGLKKVRIRGLHVFAASNELDASRLLATHAMVLALGHRMQDALGVPLEQIDLGGGLGVPYTARFDPLDVEELGRGLESLLADASWFKGELILEPGRYLAAECGLYLVRVVRSKRSRGTRFLILEAGVNHLLRPLLTGQDFPIRAVGASGALSPATLAGPLCTSLDRLGTTELPDLEPGALLAFGVCGAYGKTEAMTQFLSHPEATEVWFDGSGPAQPANLTRS
ncbi:MAG: alanine racemase [Planctomycetes bacterium]|nr:alanine racemase [Planctomycetota bacterium]